MSEEKYEDNGNRKTLLWKESERKSRKHGSLSSVYWVTSKPKSSGTRELKLSSDNGPKFATGVRYAGSWKNNYKHGFGTQEWTCGTKYEGEWNGGKRCGSGTLWVSAGKNKGLRKEYTGDWKDNKRSGFGVNNYTKYKYLADSNETRHRQVIIGDATYTGNWLQNKRQGQGKMTFPNGDVYEGEWLDDKPHGVGRLILTNGDCYEGGWSRGAKEGSGRYHYSSTGKVYCGEWTQNVPKSGEYMDDTTYFADLEQSHKHPDFELPIIGLEQPDAVLNSALNETRRDRAAQYGRRELLMAQVEQKSDGRVSSNPAIFTVSELDCIQDVFAKLDRRQLGTILASQIHQGLEELDLDPSPEEIDSLLAELGVSRNSNITLEEFIGMLTTLKCDG